MYREPPRTDSYRDSGSEDCSDGDLDEHPQQSSRRPARNLWSKVVQKNN